MKLKILCLLLMAFSLDIILHGVLLISNRTPQIMMIVMFFLTLYYQNSPVIILFLCGMAYDTLCLLPLGSSSIIYIIISLFTRFYKEKLLYSGTIIKILTFSVLLIMINFIEWAFVSIYNTSFLPIRGSLIPMILTLILYYTVLPHANTLFDKN